MLYPIFLLNIALQNKPLDDPTELLTILYILFALLGVTSYAYILWRNFNFNVLKRLSFQSSFVIVTFMCIYYLVITFSRERRGLGLTAITYVGFSMIVVTIDVIEEKSRYFAILCVLFSVAANVVSIIRYIFYDSGLDKDNEYERFAFDQKVRTERRKVYLTILTHTLGGLITILRDSNNIKLAFVKDRVYRETSKFIYW